MNEVRDKILEHLACTDLKETILLERSDRRICLSSRDGSAWRLRRLSALLDAVIMRVAAYEGWRSVIALTDCLTALYEDAGELEVHWFDQTAFPMLGTIIEDAWKHGPVVHFCDGIQIEAGDD